MPEHGSGFVRLLIMNAASFLCVEDTIPEKRGLAKPVWEKTAGSGHLRTEDASEKTGISCRTALPVRINQCYTVNCRKNGCVI